MKKYRLKNLDCAVCAGKIESELKKQKDVRFAAVNFSTSELIVDADDTEKIVEIIKKVEPDIEVLELDETDHEEDVNMKREIFTIGLSFILFVASIVFEPTFHNTSLEYPLFLAAYLLAGYRVIIKAAKNVINKRPFEENFLITIATVGAILIHEIPEAIAVMLFFRVGEFMQDLAVGKSRRSVKALLEIKPTFANLKVGEEIRKVNPEDVKVGSLIVVRPGEKVPLDGLVVDGSSFVDTSALTGESKPQRIVTGDEVLSGMVNLSGLITVKVTKPFSDSTVSRFLKLVEDAASRKAKTEKFITRFAQYYTPAVIVTAAAIAVIPPLVFGENFYPWIYRALVLLVISCPCALVLSVPLSYFAAIGRAAREGVLIKGANFLEVLKGAKIFAFDKTGTLTEGTFKVTDIIPKNGFSRSEVLKYAALAEANSNHPIARSIVEYCGEQNVNAKVEKYREIAGKGVIAEISNSEKVTIVAGNDALMHEMSIEHELCDTEGTVVHVAVNGIYAGYIIVSDRLKEGSKLAVKELKKMGRRVVMVTGDRKEVAESIAKKLGIDEFYAELLPQDKVDVIERLREDGKVVFVGDGINDAPVIARADVGVAMGALGSDAAIEAADVVILDDEPSKVVRGVKLSLKTSKIVWQNITIALSVKAAFLTLGALGSATMWEAVFADVGVTLIAVLNSMRIFK